MTNPGPWTASGQPETKKSRTWWVVGGVVAAALAVFLAYLMGRGWDEAVEQETSRTAPVASSSAPIPQTETTQAERQPGVGYKDPNVLSEDLKSIAGVSISPVQADSISTHLCNSLDAGATLRQVADEAARATSGKWSDSQARMTAMMMMLEYCPRHAE